MLQASVCFVRSSDFNHEIQALFPPVNQCGQNRVQNVIQMFARVFRQKAQDEISVLLQERILPAVGPVF
jgi:hypothetical protein